MIEVICISEAVLINSEDLERCGKEYFQLKKEDQKNSYLQDQPEEARAFIVWEANRLADEAGRIAEEMLKIKDMGERAEYLTQIPRELYEKVLSQAVEKRMELQPKVLSTSR